MAEREEEEEDDISSSSASWALQRMTPFNVRALADDDVAFLHEMLREASCWDEEPGRTSVDDVLADPALARYVAGWGRAGDAGVVAETDVGERVGAAWYRLFDADDRGFGFVAADIPELGIATAPGWRARGVGTALLEALIGRARVDNHGALSLSVDDGNAAARRLYGHVGFTRVERVGDSWTMRLELTRSR